MELTLPTDPAEQSRLMAQINHAYADKLRAFRLEHGQTPVAVGGDRRKGARLGYFQERLYDGTHGYYMRRSDDCLQVMIATALQLPPHVVPDLRLDDKLAAGHDPDQLERWAWEKLIAWADRLGVTIWLHATAPTTGRWIGVIPQPGMFNDHCVLMDGTVRVFDPASRPEEPPQFDHLPVDYGLTIRKD